MSSFEDPTLDSNNDRFLSSQDNLILDSGTKRLIDLTSHAPQYRTSESIEEVLAILQRKSPKLLDGLADSNKAQMAKQCELKTYSKDEVVFHQGDEPDAYYTVIRGAVSIYALNSSVAKSGCDGGGSSCCDAGSSCDEFVAMRNGREKYGIFIMQLPPGESFGELSFNENGIHSRRNASIISDGSHGESRLTITNSALSSAPIVQPDVEASDVCVLLLVPEKVYMSKMLARHSAKHQTEDKIAFLKESILFKHWTMDQLVKMAYVMKKTQYPKGSVLIHQDERVQYLWIIREGMVRVSHKMFSKQGIKPIQKIMSSDDNEQRRSAVQRSIIVDYADLGVNDVIGLIETLDENLKKSQREVVAQCYTELFVLPLSLFRSLVAQDGRTLAMVENVVERRKKWELLRKEYASKFPQMAMTLPKDASLLSNYALYVCNDISSAKSKKKHYSIAPKGCQANGSMSTETVTRRRRGRARVDGLMRKNRENTLALFVAEAGF